MLDCKGSVVSYVFGLFQGYLVSLCEGGKYKGPSHWHVGVFTTWGVDELAQGAGVVLKEYGIQDGSLGIQL